MFATISNSATQITGGFTSNANDNNASVQAMQSLQQTPQSKPVAETQNSQKNDGNFSGGFGDNNQPRGTNNPPNLGNNVDQFV